MKKNLLLFFMLFSLVSFAQTRFDRQTSIPVVEGNNTLHFPWAGGINFPYMSAIDLNHDGLQDIFMYDKQNNRILTFTNNGNTDFNLAWEYAPDYTKVFPPVNKWVFLYDYNCDGLADFFTLSTAIMCSGIEVFRNDYTPGNGYQWTKVDTCMQETFSNMQSNIFANSVSLPHFNDYDGDGDMDVLGYNSVPNGRIMYHRNISMDSLGNCDQLLFVLESECLGHFQLKIGGTNTVGCFHCNCRSGSPYAPGTSNYESYDQVSGNIPSHNQSDAARRDDTVSSVFCLDLDGDGNKELLVGDVAADNTLMVHNGGLEMDDSDTLFPSYNIPANFNGFHYHAYIDVDNDGMKDLIVMPNDHENKKGLWFYKNNGTNPSPVFDYAANAFLQKEMIDVGEDACPVFFDYDNDNLLDLVIGKAVYDRITGAYKAGLYLYRNVGTQSSPSFQYITDDFAGLTGPGLTVNPVYPAFGDLDNDGDKDMLIGMEDGKFHYYINTGGNPPVFQGPFANYMSIDVGKHATPQLYDLNKDGLLDIICGEQGGFVNYFKNRGTLSSPLFDVIPTEDTLGCIVLQALPTTDGYSVPFLYDSLGSTRLLVANETGNIFEYNNIDGNLTGCFNQVGTVYHPAESTRSKFNITVSGGDLNGDSLADIVVGQSTGGAEIWYQVSATSAIADVNEVKPTFEVFPNPVKDEMKIKFYHQGNNSAILRVFNPLGELVTERLLKKETVELKTTTWADGIYLVQLTAGKYTTGKKVVINH